MGRRPPPGSLGRRDCRVNLIRAVALVGFYGYHLLNVYIFTHTPSLKNGYNLKVTIVVLAWR